MPKSIATSIAAATALAGPAVAQGPPGPPKPPVAAGPKAEYPPFDAVTKGLTKVISTADGAAPFYELYQDKKTGRDVESSSGHEQPSIP